MNQLIIEYLHIDSKKPTETREKYENGTEERERNNFVKFKGHSCPKDAQWKDGIESHKNAIFKVKLENKE